MQYEIKLFEKVKCLVKTIKKWFLKKLSVWLELIKMEVWVINYKKWQDIYIYIYFTIKSIWQVVNNR